MAMSMDIKKTQPFGPASNAGGGGPFPAPRPPLHAFGLGVCAFLPFHLPSKPVKNVGEGTFARWAGMVPSQEPSRN